MICSGCRGTPCISTHMIQIGREHKASTSNDNQLVRFYLCQMRTYKTYGILVRGQRVKSLHCIENKIKLAFRNEDRDDFVGFKSTNEHGQTLVIKFSL